MEALQERSPSWEHLNFTKQEQQLALWVRVMNTISLFSNKMGMAYKEKHLVCTAQNLLDFIKMMNQTSTQNCLNKHKFHHFAITSSVSGLDPYWENMGSDLEDREVRPFCMEECITIPLQVSPTLLYTTGCDSMLFFTLGQISQNFNCNGANNYKTRLLNILHY